MNSEDMESLQRELVTSLGSMSLDEARATLAAAQKMLSAAQDEHEQAQKNVMKAQASASPEAPVPKRNTEQPSPKAKKPLKSSKTVQSSRSDMNTSSVMITEEMRAAMREAEALKAEMEKARAECDSRLLDTKNALASLESAQREKEKLGRKLAEDSENMSKLMAEEKAKMDEGRGAVKTSHSQDTSSNDEISSKSFPLTDFTKKKEPKVELSVVDENMSPGAHFTVQYTLEGGAWDEDDAIYLQCAVPPGVMNTENGNKCYSDQAERAIGLSCLYSEEDTANGNAYEDFLYTTEPSIAHVDYRREGENTEGPLIGEVSIQLPLYGGWYCLSYVRTTTCLSGTGSSQTIVRTRKVLARMRLSHYASQKVGYGIPQTAPGQNQHQKHGLENDHIAGSVSTVKRRSAGPMRFPIDPAQVHVCVKNLRRLSTLHVILTFPTAFRFYRSLSRVRSWLYDTGEGKLSCLVEADVVNANNEQCSDSRAPCTVYFQSMLQYPAYLVNPQDVKSCLSFAEATVSQLASGALCISIPYTSSTQNSPEYVQQSAYAGSSQASSLPLSAKTPQYTSPIQCAACGAKLLGDDTRITSVSQLPTGIFDNMMHEFICAEEHAAGLNLCSNEVTTPKATLLQGEVQVSACPDDVKPGALLVECKEVPSLLDLFMGFGGALATAPYTYTSPNSNNFQNRGVMPPAVVSIDTCSLSCSRCLNYLGDALLKSVSGEDEGDASISNPDTDAQAQDGAQEQLDLTDIRDVRFSLSGVSLPVDLLNHRMGTVTTSGHTGTVQRGYDSRGALSMESAVARAILHLHDTYSSQSFVLHVPTSQVDSPDCTIGNGSVNQRSIDKNTLILLRLVSTNCAVYSASDDQAYQEALIVRFSWASSESLLVPNPVLANAGNEEGHTKLHRSKPRPRVTGREARLPLMYHDLVQLLGIFIKRSHELGELPDIASEEQPSPEAPHYVESYILRDCACK